MSISEADLVAVDEFLERDDKTLDGPQPDWTKNGFGDYQVAWPIIEEGSGVTRASLRLRIPVVAYNNPSVGLVFRRKMVSRIDLARPSICEPNPPYAQRNGLPSRVCGPHVHTWADNRAHVALTGLWELPARRAVTDNMRRLDQMYYWFCDQIRVKIPTPYRNLHMPDRGLFDHPHA